MLRRVLLKAYDSEDQDLASFVAATEAYIKDSQKCLSHQIQQYKKLVNDADKQAEIPRLESVLKTLKEMSPLIQVDYRDIKGHEKFSLVTNVRRNADGKLLLREANQSAALIEMADIREAMKEHPDAHE